MKPWIEHPDIIKIAESLPDRIPETEKPKKETPIVKPESPIIIPSTIDSEKYLQIPNTNIIIAREETFKGKDWYQTHEELKKENLFMPTIPLFISHFMNVKNAYDKKTKLYTASGRELSRSDTENLYKYLTTDFNKGCWTWLDAFFEQRPNGLYILTKNKTIEEKLDCPIQEDCYVNLNFNKQGMPIQKSSKQKYFQGKNIYFYYPKNGSVARFYACSDGANLSWNGGPSGTYGSLRVFSCKAILANNSQGDKIK